VTATDPENRAADQLRNSCQDLAAGAQ